MEMENDKTLVVLAGGMATRFGRLKQIEPIDKDRNFLIDYSIYDAKKAGFNKVVFVIKEENQEIFSETVGNRIAGVIDVDYAYQSLDKFVPQVPEGRVKPWGTGHAVLCAKDKVQGNFAIINADDFYGRDAFMTASAFMDKNTSQKEYGLVAYNVGNTLTENGAVKRGVCEEKDGLLTGMTESSIEIVGDEIVASPLSKEPPFTLEPDHPVSMNLICFNSNFFNYLEKDFQTFLEQNEGDLSSCEYLIQDGMFHQIQDEGAQTHLLETHAVWHGITYREDKDKVVDALEELKQEGEYPMHLWEKQRESAIQNILAGKSNEEPVSEEPASNEAPVTLSTDSAFAQ